MPPLRERIEDLPALVAVLLYRIAERTKSPLKGLTQDALEQLFAHDWPGNVRELENCLERAYLLAEGELLGGADLQFDVPPTDGARSGRPEETSLVGRTLPDLEKDLIEQTLGACGHNVSETARRLGISRDILRYRLKKYGIERGRGG
jgi:DNA-binding NtrC family response regulator